MPENTTAPETLLKNPLLFYIKQNKRAFGLGIFFLIITNSLDGVYPLFIKKVLDEVSASGLSAAIIQGKIGFYSLTFFATMLGLAGTRFLWRVYFGRYHTEAAEDLRNRIFKHLTSMGPTFFMKNSLGELMSVMVSDVQAFRSAIGGGVLIFVDGLVIMSIVLPLMVWLNPSWTWKTLILLPLIPFLINTITKAIFSSFKFQQDRLAELSGVSQEIVGGIRVIKSFAQEENKLKDYNTYSANFEKSCVRTAKWDSLFTPAMEFGVASGSVILLFVAGKDVLEGVATIGTFVAFQRYITKMVWPMTSLGLGYSQFQKGMASFSRIRDLFNQQTDIPDLGIRTIDHFHELQVRNLSYQFPGAKEYALKNLNFQIHAGEFVGIVGPVGAGKTTLMHLLTRLYPVQQGEILVNGVRIEDLTQKNLRETISMVPQEAFLFSESIAENISYGLGESAVETELVHWATAVDIDAEVQNLPVGYKSQLGERGVNLSGGQKQRLTIARALITQSPVVILDDSLSAVDVSTEAKIKEALLQLKQVKDALIQKKKKTRIIIAHRLSTIENADKIIVLNEGQIEAIGTHQELMHSSRTYQQMATLQEMSKEGLA
jgi:ATP-binding cassette subfamily B multidrug efflux pump